MPIDHESGAVVARALGLDEHDLQVQPVAGGDIAEAAVLAATDASVFVKFLPPGRAGLLSAEADGLQAIAATGAVRVPRVIGRGSLDDGAWLALEFLSLGARGTQADRRLGRQLAELHHHTDDRYGWHRNNYIGLTPQANPRSEDWAEFFLEHRLGAQFNRLMQRDRGRDWPAIRRAVADAWRRRFGDHDPPASLIHGDLWSGNAASLPADQPVVFDPAAHYADRECDLAMTELFGGFSDAFYQAYEQAWPRPDGHRQRALFYRLYHVLNHANLFGAPYVDSAAHLADRIIRRI